MQTFQEFLEDLDPDRYGPDTILVKNLIMSWLAINNSDIPLNLKKFNIHTLPVLPDTVTNLICGNGYLVYIRSLPPNLERFECHYAPSVRKLPVLPNTLKVLNVTGTAIKSLPLLPLSLTSIYAASTKLEVLPDLYSGIKHIVVAGTPINRLRFIPDTLETLDISGTNITALPNLGNSLKHLNISNTSISIIPRFPYTLKQIYAYSCEKLFVEWQRDNIEEYEQKWRNWHMKVAEMLRITERNNVMKEDIIMRSMKFDCQ